MNLWDEIKDSFKEGSALTRLIYINLCIFLMIGIVRVLFFLGGNGNAFQEWVMEWMALPADFGALASRPWTLITYMFLHFEFLHILFNLLWLYWMGQIFLSYFNQAKLVTLYLFGGITGGLFYVAAYNSFPVFSQIVSDSRLLGASASVIAIVTATAVNAPNHKLHLMFIGAVKMKYIALFSVLLYVIGISSTNAGGNLAHVGGALGGVIYVFLLGKGIDPGKIIARVSASAKKIVAPKPNVKMTYKKPVDEIEYNRIQNRDKKRMNDILEKISRSGYDSLSKDEKEILFRMGK